jgi:hypothetical protein
VCKNALETKIENIFETKFVRKNAFETKMESIFETNLVCKNALGIFTSPLAHYDGVAFLNSGKSLFHWSSNGNLKTLFQTRIVIRDFSLFYRRIEIVNGALPQSRVARGFVYQIKNPNFGKIWWALE